MINLKISFLPKYRLSKWSVGLNIYCVIISIFLYIFAELQKVITVDIILIIFGVTTVIASLIASFIGVVAVIKNTERSVLVFLSILIGFVVLAFIFGDIFGLPDV